MKFASSPWVVTAVLALAACDPGGGGAIPCTAGEQKTCGCPGGAPEGVQVCSADGTFGDCACGSSTTTNTGAGGAGTGASSTGGTTGGTGGVTGGTGGVTGGTGGVTGGTGGVTGGTGGVTGGTGGVTTGGTGGITGGTGGGTTSMPMPCDNVFQGSFTIQNMIDVNAIAPYCEITGDLTVNAPGLAAVSLPNLRALDGNLTVPGPLPSLDLPALETAGVVQVTAGAVNFASLSAVTSLKVKVPSVALPVLASATGKISLTTTSPVSLPALTTAGQIDIWASGKIDVPNLTVVTGSAAFQTSDLAGFILGAPKLTSVQSLGLMSVNSATLPLLATVDLAITIDEGQPSLNLSLPSLTTAGQFDVRAHGTVSAPNLVTITTGDLRIKRWSGMSLPKLKTVGNWLWVRETTLATLDLPALESIGDLFQLGGINAGAPCVDNPPTEGNLSLTKLTLPKLTKVGTFNATWISMGLNPLLPQCRVDALVNQLEANGWTGQIKNEQPAVCTLAAGPCP